MIFRKMAQEVGLDEYEFADGVSSEKTEKKILAEKERGKALGIRRTPTYYVNGRMVAGVTNLQLEINGLLNKIKEQKQKDSSKDDCDSEASDVCPDEA